MRRLLLAGLTAALVAQGGPVAAREYTDSGWDPADSGGERLDISTSQRKVWTRESDGTSWLVVRFSSHGNNGIDWRVRVWLDSRAGPRADYIMTMNEFDMSPSSGCNVHPRPGRRGRWVRGVFIGRLTSEPGCRVPLRAVHPSKRIRWRLISIDLWNGARDVIDHAPDGVRFYP